MFCSKDKYFIGTNSVTTTYQCGPSMNCVKEFMDSGQECLQMLATALNQHIQFLCCQQFGNWWNDPLDTRISLIIFSVNCFISLRSGF